MTIKITTPNGGADSLDFGCARTAIVATVTGTEVSSGEGKLAFNTTTSGTSKERMRLLNNGTLEAQSPASATGIQAFKIDWKNENNAGVMASIGCDRTASSAAPADLVFSTSTSVDSGAISEKFRVTSDGRGLSQFTAKGWINFDGTGTIAINDSHNITSITDNGTGLYTVTIAVDMASVNYALTVIGDDTGSRGNNMGHAKAYAVGSFQVLIIDDASTSTDADIVGCIFFGD